MSQRGNGRPNARNQSKSSSSSIGSRRIVALPTDIICGRGFHIVNHRGNLNLHLMVNSHREEYTAARRSEKTKITKRLLCEIKNSGARFIRKVVSDGKSHADEWEEVDDVTAYKKVSHALRLRTKNESNRDNGPIAAGAPSQDDIGNFINETSENQVASSNPEYDSSSAPSDDIPADSREAV